MVTHGADHPYVADSLSSLGILALAEQRPTDALPLLERAIELYDASEGVQMFELETHFALARALALTKGDPSRARSEARRAAEGFRAAGEGKAKQLAEVEAFLAKRGGGR